MFKNGYWEAPKRWYQFLVITKERQTWARKRNNLLQESRRCSKMQVPHLKFGRHNFNVATPLLIHLNLSFCNQKQIQTIAFKTT